MTDTKTMQLIGEIAENVSEKNLSEITYETEDLKIRVVGKPETQITNVQVNPEVNVEQPVQPIQPTIPLEEKYIVSNIVGIVYLRPAPDKSPYVKIGDNIDADTEVCLIEAMKTFNPIRANMVGKIRAVLVKDGDPVEYGTPLFSVI